MSTLLFLEPGKSIKKLSDNEHLSTDNLHTWGIAYENKRQYKSFTLKYNQQSGDSRTRQNEQVSTYDHDLASSVNLSKDFRDVYSKKDLLNAEILINTVRYHDAQRNAKKSVSLSLRLNTQINQLRNILDRATSFTSINNSEDRQFNRRYLNNSKEFGQLISLELKDLLGETPRFFNLGLQNTFKFDHKNSIAHVSDLKNVELGYIFNKELTNSVEHNVVDCIAGVNISKTISRILDNRYRREFKIVAKPQIQNYLQKFNYQKYFQNIEKKYVRFVPALNIEYLNHKTLGPENTYILRYATSAYYPNLQQLALLVDSSNFLNQIRGNLKLVPAYAHDLSFNYRYTNGSTENLFLLI